MDESERKNQAASQVREILQRASGAPAANEVAPSADIKAARRRVHSTFGWAMLLLSLVPTVASLSPRLDAFWSFVFLICGIVVALVGAIHVDRANKADKELLRQR